MARRCDRQVQNMIDPIISVRNLTKQFGDFTAVDHISFDVGRGEIFGFLGANGAGKTTAMRMLCGLSFPTEGTGTVAGYDIRTESEQIKRHIGYMSQRFSLYQDLTVAENMKLYGGIYGLSGKEIATRVDQLLDRLNFADHRDDLVGSLPLGWKQKLAFMVAAIHRPDIVFLDEPTGGVDPITRRQFWDARELSETKARQTALCIRCWAMDSGHSVPGSMPSSYQRRYPFASRCFKMGKTLSLSLWL